MNQRIRLAVLACFASSMLASAQAPDIVAAPTFKVSPRGLEAMNVESEHRQKLDTLRREVEAVKAETDLEKARKDLERAKSGIEGGIANGQANGSPLPLLGTPPNIMPLQDSTRRPGMLGSTQDSMAPLSPPPIDLSPNPKLRLIGIADGKALFVVGKDTVVTTGLGDDLAGYKVESITTQQVTVVKKDGDPQRRARLTFTMLGL